MQIKVKDTDTYLYNRSINGREQRNTIIWY